MKNMKEIIGRDEEKKILADIYSSQEAELVAVYGRRRVGKTFLIKHFYQSKPAIFFHVTGIKDGTFVEQLQQFAKTIGDTFYDGASINVPKTWLAAYEELTKAIRKLPANKKIVLFFDELPWMATKRSRLIQSLDYFWNRYWVDLPNVKLILCGSSASWIIKKIIKHKGGLHNRITKKILLKPFNLYDTKKLLNANKIKLNNQQILQVYMALGGIPYYLKGLKKSLSVAQNINQLCFHVDGLLFDEFNEVFASLFDDAAAYKELVILVADTREGISRKKIETANKLTGKGGNLTARLEHLEMAGFITSFMPLGNRKKGLYYRISDEYCYFYLNWVGPAKRTLMKEEGNKRYWQMKVNTSKYRSWAGYAFENICYKHIGNIRRCLNIGDDAEVGSWRYIPKKGEPNTMGAQIDLLFDRSDNAITICEIKYTDKPFIIDKSYYRDLLNKAQVYRKETGSKKEIFFSMISANGVKSSIYSEEIINRVVTLDSFFKVLC